MTESTAATRKRRRIEDKVRGFAREHALWAPNDRVVVAVSGGPDSTALLMILSRLANRDGLQLVAAYFDHQLRGAGAAAAERRAVESLAASAGVALVTGSADVASEAKARRLSLEDAARRARYAFLARAAAETGCGLVATGHTASDQAETVLLHIVRGAGLDGLAGIAPRSAWPFAAPEGGRVASRPNLDAADNSGRGLLAEAPILFRPLLCLTRDETMGYCALSGIEPVDDASNASAAFLRNRVRHELMPLLSTFNPDVDGALLRLAAAARDSNEYIDAQARAALHHGGEGEVRLNLGLAARPTWLRLQAFRLAVERLLGDGRDFGERHYRALDRLALHGQTGDRLDLPRGVSANRTREGISLRLADPSVHPALLGGEPLALAVPGELVAGALTIAASECQPGEENAVAVELDAEAVGRCLSVRKRRPGDRMAPLGLKGTKKLQDLFVDEHVPRSERDSVPIFENERGIVWVGGLRIAGWAAPRPGAPTAWLSYRHSEPAP